MGNEEIIYGDAHGASYDITDGADSGKRRTHWDPMLKIDGFGRGVHLGIIPPDADKSTDDGPVYDRDRAQFITLDRSACNRAIKAIRKFRDAAYGRDE